MSHGPDPAARPGSGPSQNRQTDVSFLTRPPCPKKLPWRGQEAIPDYRAFRFARKTGQWVFRALCAPRLGPPIQPGLFEAGGPGPWLARPAMKHRLLSGIAGNPLPSDISSKPSPGNCSPQVEKIMVFSLTNSTCKITVRQGKTAVRPRWDNNANEKSRGRKNKECFQQFGGSHSQDDGPTSAGHSTCQGLKLGS